MDKIDQIREWIEEKNVILQAEKESFKGLSDVTLNVHLQEKIITSQQALLDELAQLIDTR